MYIHQHLEMHTRFAHTNKHTTDNTNFNKIQTIYLSGHGWCTNCGSLERYLDYQLVEEFVPSASWSVRHKEVLRETQNIYFCYYLILLLIA